MSKDIENKMYELANSIVGNIGDSTDNKHSVTFEEYVEFIYITKDKNEILPAWEKWIKSYMQFASFCFKDSSTAFFMLLYIYWKTKPEIKKIDEIYQCYARLLITNCIKRPDCYRASLEVKDNTIPLEELRPDYPRELYESWILAIQNNSQWKRYYSCPKASV